MADDTNTQNEPSLDQNQVKGNVNPLEPNVPDNKPHIKPNHEEEPEEEQYYEEEEEEESRKFWDKIEAKTPAIEAADRTHAQEELEKAEKEIEDLNDEKGPTPEQLKEFEQMNMDAEQDIADEEKPHITEEAKRAFAEAINKVSGERNEKEQEKEHTHDVIVDRWKGFLTKFYIQVAGERKYTYFEQILGLRAKPVNKKGDIGSTILYLNYDDLVICSAIDYNQELMNGIVSKYTENVQAIKEAVLQILQDIQPDYAEEVKNRIIVCVLDSPQVIEIAEISSQNIDKLIHLEGQVSQFDNENQIKVLENSWECTQGHITRTEADVLQKPKKCQAMLGEFDIGGRILPCGQPIIRERVDLQKVVDICYLHINEREIKIPEGRFDAPAIDVRFEGTELVKKIMGSIQPAQLVSIDGVVRTRQLSGSNHSLRDFEIEGSSYTVMPESVLIEDNPELDSEVKKDIPEPERAEHFKKLIRSVCPHLEGLTMEKMALLIQLAGSDATINIGGGRLRGELNILFVSSPSQGKSEMLRWQQRIRPRSIYVIGRGASAIGLTAGIETVDIVKNGQRISTKRIGFGIYPLCNGGIVCLDEIEKRPKEDYESLSHPMDDNQMVTIAKASMYKTIAANCGSLHAGNPTKNNGNYDYTKDFFSQINFASWLFSRYDLVFVLQDDNTEARRDRLRDYISDAYTNVRLESDIKDIQEGKAKAQTVEFDPQADWFPWQYIRREILYLREEFHPVFKFASEAGVLLWKFWNRYSGINITPSTDPYASPSEIHFTPAVDKRSIGSLIRIAKGVARLFRSNEVELSHMEIAIRVKEASIKSLTPAQTSDQAAQDQLYVKSMTRTVAEQRTKELKKQYLERQKEMRQITVRYASKIHQLFWEKCKSCNGSGQKTYHIGEVDSRERTYGQCDNCRGTKGQYPTTGFRYQDFDRRIQEMLSISAKVSLGLFQRMVLNGWLKQIKPGYYIPVVNLHEQAQNTKSLPLGGEMFIDDESAAEIERQDSLLQVPKPKSKEDQAMYDETQSDLNKFQDGNVV